MTEFAPIQYYITLIDEDFKVEPLEVPWELAEKAKYIREKYIGKTIKCSFLIKWWSITNSCIINKDWKILYL